MRSLQQPRAGEAGFSLVELMVAMVLVLVIMGATMTALNDAYRSNESARGIIDVNNNLRIGIDLMVRDFIQVGQGLPTGRLVQVPNGTGALRIQRPHPQGSACTQWPAGTTTITAVTAGPGCGPVIDGVATDMVTTIAVDSVLESVPVESYDIAGHRATVSLPAQAPGGLDISTGTSDDVRVGDLMMFTKGSASALAYVTAVNGNQTFTFGAGDPMNLNQFAAILNGTVDDLANTAPTTVRSSSVSRIRMISYFLDNTLDPTTPRLMRHMNWGDPAVAVNLRARTVAFAIENLQFTYDMVDGAGNPSNVRMVDADFTTGGACSPNPCSPNQIRKVNVFLSGRSTQTFSLTKRFFRNSLNTQVSLRSLALVDRYR
ncbi:MAG TPA: prepilin-type N-terminal cleavage/methylation domain-containing protein [Vicinamibacterales bacterium]